MVVPGYPFIVLRLSAYQYHTPDVFLYYALMVFILVGMGVYRNRAGPGAGPG